MLKEGRRKPVLGVWIWEYVGDCSEGVLPLSVLKGWMRVFLLVLVTVEGVLPLSALKGWMRVFHLFWVAAVRGSELPLS